jgi:hypothetical protein
MSRGESRMRATSATRRRPNFPLAALRNFHPGKARASPCGIARVDLFTIEAFPRDA